MEDITIIVIAFNRVKSLSRLLNSLNKLIIEDGKKVRLYISIDRDKNNSEENKEVVRFANEFKWNYGEKIINYREKNMGLRKHILECGNLSNIYNNVIILEDDIVVSPLMYSYACQVIDFYKNDSNISGFGLYSFQRNPLNNMPFYPINNGSDVYFMQYACSWGQIWTKERWNEFYCWYEKNKNKDFSTYSQIPNNIKLWGENSWLKFYEIYTILNKKYFVYPQVGLTTNFTETGTHNCTHSIAYQCYMYLYSKENTKFKFIPLDKANNVYDSFFENMKLNEILHFDKKIITDFYGEKKIEREEGYLLSSKIYNYKIIEGYSLEMYPYEMNLVNDIKGEDIFLYDINCMGEKNKYKYEKKKILKYLFKLDLLSKNDMIYITKIFIDRYKNRIIRKLTGKKK